MSTDTLIGRPVESSIESSRGAASDNLAQFRSGDVTPNVSSNTSAESHLPELQMPVALDKSVLAEHGKLVTLADSQIPEGEARQKFHADMEAFEQRADRQGLTPDQVTETYRQMERMMEPAPNSPFTAEQRQQLAGQWTDRLADPTASIRQGWHGTCGWTTLETRLATKDPDKMTAKMAEVINTGGATTFDVEKAQHLVDNGDNLDVMPTKVLPIDRDSLQPDQVPKDAWHAMAITGLDDHGNAQIYNPWGVKYTMTPEELFQAMGKPS